MRCTAPASCSAAPAIATPAIRCLEAALKISETHLPALDALELAWRERGDLERVSVILGRKVAATMRHPTRQKPLLSRLGDLQDQLGRPDVALAAHQRALEIEPQWRPSLRYVTTRLRDDGQSIASAGGFAQLAGELPCDAGADAASLLHDRGEAANALAAVAMQLDDAELDAVRDVALPALERALAVDRGRRIARRARARAGARRGAARHAGRADVGGGHAERPRIGRGRRPGCAGAARRLRARQRRRQARRRIRVARGRQPRRARRPRGAARSSSSAPPSSAITRRPRGTARRSPTRSVGARRGDALLELADILLRAPRRRALRARGDARRGRRVRRRPGRRPAPPRGDAARARERGRGAPGVGRRGRRARGDRRRPARQARHRPARGRARARRPARRCGRPGRRRDPRRSLRRRRRVAGPAARRGRPARGARGA